MNDPMHAPAEGPEATMGRTAIVRIGGFDADDAEQTMPALRVLEKIATQLATHPDLFEIEPGRAATTMIGGRSYRTAGGIVATRIADEAVIVQEAGGPGHIRFGSWRHELSLRFTEHGDRALVAMPECGGRTAVAARVAMAACIRIAAGDRIVEEADAIAMMDAAEDLILAGGRAPTMPPPSIDGDRISFASPWSGPSARRHGAAVAEDVLDRHWALRDRTPMIVVGRIAGVLVVDPVSSAMGRDATDPVVRLRRHRRDAEIRRLLAGWGMCTPPADDHGDAR